VRPNRSLGPALEAPMFVRSARLLALYLIGMLLVWSWSLSHLLGGTATRENLALVLVLPLAWTFSYWPMLGSLILAWKAHRLSSILQDWARCRSLGLPADAPEQQIEDMLTLLVAQENPIPARWARKLVRHALRAARERAGATNALS
jgi:hypothetical protein